jgi:ABC-type antimicrobial peptide transport system permease subunit
MLMSMPSAVYRSHGAFRSVRDISLDSFVFRIAESNVATVTSALSRQQAIMGSDVAIKTIYSTRSTLSTATTIVNIFFIFTQAMAMLICSFSLLSSMSTNVLNHSKEIGILRSMGMKKFPLHRLYTWEAFVLILSSSLLGLIVGIVVAYSMMLQNALLTQIPLTFQFPVAQLVTILVASLILSFIASFSPVAYLLNQPSIIHILRRVN